MLCALLYTTLAPPPPTLSAHLHSLEITTGDTLVDSCLRTMHAVPGPRSGTLLPANVGELREAAAFFNFGKSDVAGSQQHIFDVSLWDDSLEVLAEAVVEEDGALLHEAAAAIGASARLATQPPDEVAAVADSLAAAIASDAFLDARKAALAAAKQPPTAYVRPATEADAFAAARRRRKKQDYVAVAPEMQEDERIIRALYSCAVDALGPQLLQPLGFPHSRLGLRSLLAATRAAGLECATAALGRVWHAADEPGPVNLAYAGRSLRLPYNQPISTAIPPEIASTRTLVLVFSSLGWHGLVRAEYGSTLKAVGDDSLVLAHCLDTSQSWFLTNPMTGEYDDGAWWDVELAELCAPYDRVCILGESMGATAALRYAKHAKRGSVVALVPQIDVRDFGDYASGRSDFSDERKERLVESIRSSCVECCRTEQLVLHVGRDPPDLKQLAYLPTEAHESGRLKVVKHNVAGHALGAGLKEQGLLRKTILRDLLGHSYRLPPAGGL